MTHDRGYGGAGAAHARRDTGLVTVWCDAACDPAAAKPGGWAVVLRAEGGAIETRTGTVARGMGPAQAELRAIAEAFDTAPVDTPLLVLTDCRVAADAAAGRAAEPDFPEWAQVRERLDARPAPAEIRWRRRKTDAGLAAAHHLAAAARALAVLAG